jgi:hypothetical protein
MRCAATVELGLHSAAMIGGLKVSTEMACPMSRARFRSVNPAWLIPRAGGGGLGLPAGSPADYTGMAMTGVVVGPEVPPAGSTVIPIRSPGTTPEASTGPARPVPDSSPAERAPAGPITHSW